MSDIFLIALRPACGVDRVLRRCRGIDRFDLDRGGAKPPVLDLLHADKSFFCRLDRPLRTVRVADDDRTLAAVKDPFVARDIVEKADAVDRHLAGPGPDATNMPGPARTGMIWINFATGGPSSTPIASSTSCPTPGVKAFAVVNPVNPSSVKIDAAGLRRTS